MNAVKLFGEFLKPNLGKVVTAFVLIVPAFLLTPLFLFSLIYRSMTGDDIWWIIIRRAAEGEIPLDVVAYAIVALFGYLLACFIYCIASRLDFIFGKSKKI